MGLSVSQLVHGEKIGDGCSASGKNQGTLKSDGKEYQVYVFSDSESVTEAVSKFLQDANTQERPQELLLDFEFMLITPETIDVETEIGQLLQDLTKQEAPKEHGVNSRPGDKTAEEKLQSPQEAIARDTEKGDSSRSQSSTSGRSEVVYSSLFSLARTFNTSLTEARQKKETQQKNSELPKGREEGRSALLPQTASKIERQLPQESRYDREGNGKQDRQQQDEEKEGFAQHQEEKQKESQKKKNKIVSIANVQAARDKPRNTQPQTAAAQGAGTPAGQSKSAKGVLGGIENIYLRFMALMARILGQAELEAHQLYLRIKERTDAIDVLTLLISKINSEKGAIDWSNNEEMKKLLEKARAIGVDIPEGKFQWSEEEKKLLKENIQLRKDSMEKVTQLERTDMQRYLQEASQCHQARSNILKVIKEVIDTFIHNIRPA